MGHNIEASRKGGLTAYRNRVGMFARSPEKISRDARKAGSMSGQGKRNAKNKTGVCGRSPEKMSEDGRKGALASTHSRCHVRRGIVNPNCVLCIPK